LITAMSDFVKIFLTMKLSLTSFVLLFVLISCKRNAELGECTSSDTNRNYVVESSQSLTIPIHASDSYLGFANQIDEEGKLYRASRFGSKIDVYDLKYRNKVKSYVFPDSGSNHISAFGGIAFVPLGGDSLLFMNNISQLYLTHKDSVLLKKTYIEDDLLSPKENRSYGVNRVKPYRLGNNIFFIRISQYLPNTENFNNDKFLMYYNLSSGELKKANATFTNKFKNGKWTPTQMFPSFTTDNTNIIINYPIEDNLYMYDTEKDSVVSTVKCVSSRFKTSDFKPINREITDWKMYANYIKNYIQYWSISYIPQQDCFYRIVILPVDNQEDALNELMPEVVSPFSVMILDKDFKILAEDKFPGKTYDLTDFFVTDKGLWISNNNPENPNFSEDHLSFTLFELAEKLND